MSDDFEEFGLIKERGLQPIEGCTGPTGPPGVVDRLPFGYTKSVFVCPKCLGSTNEAWSYVGMAEDALCLSCFDLIFDRQTGNVRTGIPPAPRGNFLTAEEIEFLSRR